MISAMKKLLESFMKKTCRRQVKKNLGLNKQSREKVIEFTSKEMANSFNSPINIKNIA